jgi:hypothetical protein
MTRRELIENHVEKARGVIRRQGKALSTERDYCGWLRRYLAFTFTLARGLSSEAKAEAFLTMLVPQFGRMGRMGLMPGAGRLRLLDA